jgi:GNAT superfamily N-acetyltransferase
MPTIKLPIEPGAFLRLPRHASYRYHYRKGVAFLTPRAHFFHAILDLPGFLSSNSGQREDLSIGPIRDADWQPLSDLFAAAFRKQQPFSGLEDEPRREAGNQCLSLTRAGKDGPWIEAASYVAADDGRPVGAIFITLLPAGDPAERDSYYWDLPPPENALALRLGRPHLTWVFVDPNRAGQGIGTALLQAASRALIDLGYSELATTFLLGNDSSMLWHWRLGFRLLPFTESRRKLVPFVRKSRD